MNVQKMLRFDLEELDALGLALRQASKIERGMRWERVPDSPYNQVKSE